VEKMKFLQIISSKGLSNGKNLYYAILNGQTVRKGKIIIPAR
jgi:hypothetical protein